MTKPIEVETPLFGTTGDVLENAARSPVPSMSNTSNTSNASNIAAESKPSSDGDFFASSNNTSSAESKKASTGERNENSALFSLASLSHGHDDESKQRKPSSDSSIIDIKSLANGTSAVDQILSTAAGGGLASPLAAPVLAPVVAPSLALPAAEKPSGTNNTVLFSVLGASLILVGGGLGAAYILKSSPQAPARIQSEASGNSATTNSNADPPPPTTTTVTTPTPSTEAPTPSTAGRRTESSGRSDRSPRSARSTASTSATAPQQPAAQPTNTAPAAPTVSPCVRGCAGDIPCILRCGAGGSAAANTGAPAPRPSPAGGADSPSRNDVLSAMNSVRGAVRDCASSLGTHGSVPITITFASSGRVTTANVGAPLASTPAGSCAARAVRAAQVPAFSRPTFQVNYPFSY